MTIRSTTDGVLRSFAPAKLNLCLRVVGRRTDGRHLLESLFWPLDWGDELMIAPGKGPSMSLQWTADAPRPTALGTDGGNLVMRAIETGRRAGGAVAHVDLQKRLPAEAGLGGGSSDAAAVLRVLCPERVRFDAALALGADVPFFLDPRPGWMTGIGEVREAWSAEHSSAMDWGFVVAVPPFPLATARVFDHFRTEGKIAAPGAKPPEESQALCEFVVKHGNALTHSALALEPRLVPILEALRASSPLHTEMSGSGTACFAIFETLAIAKEKAQVLEEKYRTLNCKWIAAGTYRASTKTSAFGEHHGNHRGEGLPG